MTAPSIYVNLYVVQGHYGWGWEDLTAEDTYKEARARLREYHYEATAAHRLITRRVRRDNADVSYAQDVAAQRLAANA